MVRRAWSGDRSRPRPPKVKMRYDGLGRMIRSYVTTDTSEINPTVSGVRRYVRRFYLRTKPLRRCGIRADEVRLHRNGDSRPRQTEPITSQSRLHGTASTATARSASQESRRSTRTPDSTTTTRTDWCTPSEFGTNDGATNNRFIADTTVRTSAKRTPPTYST